MGSAFFRHHRFVQGALPSKGGVKGRAWKARAAKRVSQRIGAGLQLFQGQRDAGREASASRPGRICSKILARRQWSLDFLQMVGFSQFV
jgi:hypothetical protein